jgi:hypothetical protein
MFKKFTLSLILMTLTLNIYAQKTTTSKDKSTVPSKKETTDNKVKTVDTNAKKTETNTSKTLALATPKLTETNTIKTPNLPLNNSVIAMGDGYSIIRTKYNPALDKPQGLTVANTVQVIDSEKIKAKDSINIKPTKVKDSVNIKPNKIKDSVVIKPKDSLILTPIDAVIIKKEEPIVIQKPTPKVVEQLDSIWLKSGEILTGKIALDKDKNALLFTRDTLINAELKAIDINKLVIFPKKYDEDRLDVVSLLDEFYFLETSPKAIIRVYANRTFKAVLNDGPKQFIVQNKYCLMKNNIPYFITNGRPKETLKFLMNDCKTVSEGFKSGKFNKDNFIEAVSQYNRCDK